MPPAQVLDVKLPFDERALLDEHSGVIQRSLGLQHFAVHAAEDSAADNPRIADARPGAPIALFSS